MLLNILLTLSAFYLNILIKAFFSRLEVGRSIRAKLLNISAVLWQIVNITKADAKSVVTSAFSLDSSASAVGSTSSLSNSNVTISATSLAAAQSLLSGSKYDKIFTSLILYSFLIYYEFFLLSLSRMLNYRIMFV
jgi:hypothetical protein